MVELNYSLAEEEALFNDEELKIEEMDIFAGLDFMYRSDGRHIKRLCKDKKAHSKVDVLIGLNIEEVVDGDKLVKK